MSAGPEIAVVPIREEHIESYHACMDAVCRERQSLAFSVVPTPVATRDYVLQNLLFCNPQFVAECNHEVVGWCDIIRIDQPSRAHVGTLGMGVAREFRQRGIGRRLLLAALERAAQVYLESVELTVHASNVAAIRLYESAGFTREDIRPDPCKVDGLYQDVLVMAKELPQLPR